jgi:hypothetical protein
MTRLRLYGDVFDDMYTRQPHTVGTYPDVELTILLIFEFIRCAFLIYHENSQILTANVLLIIAKYFKIDLI